MRRSFWLIAILLGAIMSMPYTYGAKVSPEGALARLQSGNIKAMMPEKRVADYTLTATIGNLYVFSGKYGYVVLPNDDEAPAVLGYSETCRFDAESNPNLAYWLEFLNGELDYLNHNPQLSSVKATRAERVAIPPMITTRWNQGAPYNNDCPTVGSTKCVTGCVATAMAQVLKYHNYPNKGTDKASYTWNNQELSFDYGNTTFDWDAMTDTYDSSSSAESKKAVATLMYACGVGVKMIYGPYSSGAPSVYIPSALINYFNYDKSLWLAPRSLYGIADWENLIYNELREGRPVLYGGQGSGGGHQFVCDGYSENGYFHFNWGWGGMSDGYFLLTALNPGSLGTGGGAGGYNIDQDAVIGVQPAKEDSQPTYLVYNNSDFAAASETTTLGSTISFTGAFMNSSNNTVPELYFGIRIKNNSLDKYVGTTYKISDFKSYSYYEGFNISLPKDLTTGSYAITPAYRIGNGNWQEMNTPLNYVGSLNANVDGNTIKFTTPAKATVKISNISIGLIYIGRTVPLSYTIENPGTDEFLGEITPCLMDKDNNVIATSDPLPIDMTGGQTATYKDITMTFNAVQKASFDAGDYRFAFRNESGENLNEPINVAVKDAPSESTSITVTEFSLASPNPVTNKTSVKFNVGVECNSGYFSDNLRVVIFPYQEGQVTSVYSGSTPYYYLEAGQKEIKPAELDLSSLENGKYFAMVYYGQNQASNTQIKFDINDVETSIGDLPEDMKQKEIIFDLNGVRHSRPLAPGIYIINGVKTLIR